MDEADIHTYLYQLRHSTGSPPKSSRQQKIQQKQVWNRTVPFLRLEDASIGRNRHKNRNFRSIGTVPLAKFKIEIASTISEDKLSVHRERDLTALSNTLVCVSFCSKQNKNCVFCQKFEFHGDQLILTEIVNLNHRESYSLHKNG